MTKAFRTDVDNAVAHGMLTKAQADKLYDTLAERADRLVDMASAGFASSSAAARRLHLGFRMNYNVPGARFDLDGRASAARERPAALSVF